MFAVLDDKSRLCCHGQWYLQEDAETFAHGLQQAFLKRGLSRALMTDNGGAETAAEIEEGLAELGVLQELTLPYSPYQNAKQEVFWVPIETRLLAMLEGVPDLTLEQLNQATQAWIELEYHRRVHSETGPDAAGVVPGVEQRAARLPGGAGVAARLSSQGAAHAAPQ